MVWRAISVWPWGVATSSTHIMNPRFLTCMGFYDVASTICQSNATSPKHHRHACWNPRFVSSTGKYDVASDIWQVLPGPMTPMPPGTAIPAAAMPPVLRD